MTIQITTHRDVLRHTVRRVAVAVGLAIVMTATITLLHLGTNPAALVRVDDVIIMSLWPRAMGCDFSCPGCTQPR